MKAYLDQYIEELLSLGRYTFARSELDGRFGVGDAAIRQCLQRLMRVGSVRSIRSGFHVIIPPEYRSRGMLPPEMFIDDFMKHLGRSYYVGLLSAAALHGAAHQQPQSFSTIITKPSIRPVQSNGINLIFPVKSAMPLNGIDQKKSAAGFFRVSSPELTAIDLLSYLRLVGGVSSVVQVVEELIELMSEERLGRIAEGTAKTAPLQRLGYMLEEVFGEKELANVLLRELAKRDYFHIPLTPGGRLSKCPVNSKWKIKINENLEGEL